jgi:hypothetical protein
VAAKGKGVEVGVGYVSIVPSTRGFAAQLKRDLNPRKLGNDIGKDLDRGIEQGIGNDPVGKRLAPSKDSLKGAGSQLDSMLGGLKKVAVGAAVAGGAVVAVGVDAFKSYSDQNEAITKAQQVFGDAFGRVDAVAQGAAKTMGMSRTVALDTAATYGNLFRAMGIGTDKSADMSLSLEQLAADLASFNNVPVEDSLQALRSGLVGEIEPLRRYGVNLNQARIEAEALSLGLVHNRVVSSEVTSATSQLEKAQVAAATALKKHGENSVEFRDAQAGVALAEARVEKAMRGHEVVLDAAQKAQAAYSIIMKDTAIAQGDYSRTADGAANKTRTLGAEWDNFKAKVGEKLYPLGTAVLGGLQTGLEWLNAWWAEHGDQVLGGLDSIRAKFFDIFGPDPVENFKVGLSTIQEGLNGLFGEDKVGNFMAGAAIVAQKMDEVFGPDKAASLHAGADEIAAAADKTTPAWEALGGVLLWFKDAVLDPLWGTVQVVGPLIAKTLGNVVEVVESLLDALGKLGEPLGAVWDKLTSISWFPEGWSGGPIEGHDAGGVVSGAVGSPQLVVAHGGETVLPTHRSALAGLRGVTAGQLAPAAAGGPLVGTMTVNGQADPAGSAWAMRRELRRVAYYAGSVYGGAE